MRWLLTLILIPLALQLLSGCGSSATPVLDRAEALMESHPDSALALLQALPSSRLSRSSDRARHALLLTQAKDKNYIDVADDSLISIADRYYRRSASDPRRRMLAAFYHGRVRFNASDYPRALQLFSESLDLATALPDTFWMARSASELATIYECNFHSKEELRYSLTAWEYFSKANAQPYADYALLSYGTALLNDQQPAKACEISIQIQDSAIVHHNVTLHLHALELEAHSYINRQQYDRAIPILEDLLARRTISSDYIKLLVYAYIQTNNHSKIESLKLINDTTTILNTIPSEVDICIAAHKHDYKHAYNLSCQLLHHNDSILNSYLSASLAASIDDYRQYEKKLLTMDINNQRIRLISLITLSAIISILLIWGCLRRIKQQRSKLERQYAVAENLREILALNESKYSEAQQQIRQMFLARFDIFDQLCSKYYETKALKHHDKQIASELSAIITDFSASSPKLIELASVLDDKQERILSKFKQDFPNLKQQDYMLFTYNAFGFSTNAIALFMHEEKASYIYNRKFRLRIKIKNSTSINKEKYLRILS